MDFVRLPLSEMGGDGGREETGEGEAMLGLKNIFIFGFIAFLAAPAAAAVDCVRPPEPVLPDGATATKEDMIATVRGVKDYQAALISFRECLDAEKEAAGDDISKDIKIISVQRYNASVDAEEVFIAEFNVQIRAYKAAQSKDK